MKPCPTLLLPLLVPIFYTAPLPAARVVAVDTTEWFIDRAAAPPGAGPGTDE